MRTAMLSIIVMTTLIAGGAMAVDEIIKDRCEYVGQHHAFVAGKFEAAVDVYDCGAYGKFEIVK